WRSTRVTPTSTTRLGPAPRGWFQATALPPERSARLLAASNAPAARAAAGHEARRRKARHPPRRARPLGAAPTERVLSSIPPSRSFHDDARHLEIPGAGQTADAGGPPLAHAVRT